MMIKTIMAGLAICATASAADTTAPTISNIRISNITSTGATVTWTTNEPALGQVKYGTTTAYGYWTATPTTYKTSHTATMTRLAANTLYNYKVRVRDAAGNYNWSSNLTFRTLSSTSPSPSPSPSPTPTVTATPSPSPTATTTTDYILYMSPTGNDANAGTSRTSPIRTLNRALQILAQANPQKNVQIYVAAGTYYAQTVNWTWTRTNYSLTITRDPLAGTNRPVFDGCTQAPVTDPATQCKGGTWFNMYNSGGVATNINITGLKVQNYQYGVNFAGSRNSTNTGNRKNRVEDMVFDRIGNIFNPNLTYATAAVRLVNSKENVVRNNQFTNVVNVPPYGGWIHSIYAASYSSGNLIENNVYQNNSGDDIRIRDNSNNNTIRGNTLNHTGVNAAYTDWFCDPAESSDCGTLRECPSWDNLFTGNSYGYTYRGTALKEYELFQSDETNGCTPPTPNSQRVITSQNTSLL